MRERLENWASYFAAVGVAVWAAAGILFLLGNQPNERLIALVVIGILAFALYIYARPQAVKDALTSRGARYGSNSVVVSIVFIAIVGLIAYLGERYNQRWDTTADKSNTLAPLSVKVVQDLKEPVQAIAFYTLTGGLNRSEAEDRLKEYAHFSDKFTYKFIDPQAEPQIAQEYKVQMDGTIVFERGKRRENTFQADEQSITNAIVKVAQDTQPTLYLTTGHGEHAPRDSGENGYGMMASAMESINYKVEVINLKTVTETLPADIKVLVIAGPRQPFEPEEVARVKTYLENGGRALIMLDPQTTTGLEDLLSAWGVQVRNDVIVDPKFGFYGQAYIPVVSAYGNHEVVKEMVGLGTFFPSARSLTRATNAPAGRSAIALFSTSDASWGETDFEQIKNQKPQLDVNTDVKGPLDLAYAVEVAGEKPTRLVVFGNSTFITNGTLNARITVGGQQQRVQSGNGLLFENSLHWLAGQENLIQIPPKQSEARQLLMTTEQQSFVFWSSFLLIPLAILIVGALVWWRRR
ncbi:MAG: GldG family protein [Chloroflexi bacterium]|nr:GldG family protein [Chloroflexota bacterium]